FQTVFIVKLNGACDGRTPFPLQSTRQDAFDTPLRLAATEMRGGEVLARTELECNQMKPGFGRMPHGERVRRLANTLGTVLAHELYHLLAQTGGHGHGGVSKGVLTWDELEGTTLAFTAQDWREMGRSLHPAPAPHQVER